jgi:hypothetical protein
MSAPVLALSFLSMAVSATGIDYINRSISANKKNDKKGCTKSKVSKTSKYFLVLVLMLSLLMMLYQGYKLFAGQGGMNAIQAKMANVRARANMQPSPVVPAAP